MKGDPNKLLDDLVASAAGDEPSDAQLARLSARLGPLLAAPGGGPSGHGPGGAGAAGGGALGKWLLGATAAAVVGGGGYVAYRSARQDPTVVAVVSPADAGAGAVEIADAAPLTADAAADAGVHRANHRQSAAEALAEETRLLGRAQSALTAGDGRGALRWVDRHARRFPKGALAEERERLAIEALVRLGRRAGAEDRAEKFRRRFPRSVQWPRIRELLDGTR